MVALEHWRNTTIVSSFRNDVGRPKSTAAIPSSSSSSSSFSFRRRASSRCAANLICNSTLELVDPPSLLCSLSSLHPSLQSTKNSSWRSFGLQNSSSKGNLEWILKRELTSAPVLRWRRVCCLHVSRWTSSALA